MTAASGAAPPAAALEAYFAIKTACDVDGTMAYFSPELATYTDATLGWNLDSWDALQSIFAQYMPGWGPPGRSYATRILANDTSALVHMVDTPELFGGELRILAAVDFADGRIVRWLDYWDSSAFDDDLYDQLRTPTESFPTDLKDGIVATRAAPELVEAATALHAALAAADGPGARALLHPDVVFEDMALRAQVVGRIETVAYLGRVLGRVPYGRGSTLRHVVGGAEGGGFEWTSVGGLTGITAIEREPGGLVTRITSVYDSCQLDPGLKDVLLLAAFAA